MSQKLWIDTRLQTEEMACLNKIVTNSQQKYGTFNANSSLAGNISKSELIIDEDNWLYEHFLKQLTERMFYNSREESPDIPEFELEKLWVNYQRQYEFNPAHGHSGLYSFVIFVKIPTHWKEQHALPFSTHSNMPCASDFQFIWTEMNSKRCMTTNFRLCPDDEGRMLFFPAKLLHIVYPFYGTKEKRVTISGNIVLKESKPLKKAGEKEGSI